MGFYARCLSECLLGVYFDVCTLFPSRALGEAELCTLGDESAFVRPPAGFWMGTSASSMLRSRLTWAQCWFLLAQLCRLQSKITQRSPKNLQRKIVKRYTLQLLSTHDFPWKYFVAVIRVAVGDVTWHHATLVCLKSNFRLVPKFTPLQTNTYTSEKFIAIKPPSMLHGFEELNFGPRLFL